MRKRNKKGRILSRPKSQREALLRTLAGNLFLREKITTSEARAKELRSLAEKCITKAKRKNLANRRILAGLLSPLVVQKLFDEIAPRYENRLGGYTRIVRKNPRKSDGAKMAIIELIE